MKVKQVRHIILLKDVFILSITAFGGPQGHFSIFLDRLVQKRGYMTEKGLLELYALCQLLPGPTSTQVITAVGYKIGGATLAYLTLLVWVLPAVIVMTTLGMMVNLNISLEFMKFIPPMVVAIIAFSGIRMIHKVINTPKEWCLLFFSILACLIFRTPFLFPALILFGGIVTAINYKKLPIEKLESIKIRWSNLYLWAGILPIAALLGELTQERVILIFENFYRNGSLIFGGGQVLVPLLYTEFVEFKKYISSQEFITGYGFVQGIPGPVFSFAAFVGSVSMKDMGASYQVMGGIVSALGVFLPGTFIIFFISNFWEKLKRYRGVRASLSGIHAVSTGMIFGATLLIFFTIEHSWINILIIPVIFLILKYTKIPMPILILIGIVSGIIF